MQKLIMALLALAGLASTALANGGYYYQRYWNGCGYGYRQVYYQPQYQPAYAPPPPQYPPQYPPQEYKKETTIVNNLIGIPVPVQYTQPVAQQGTTVYGYSTVAEAYGQVDLGLLYNQAARLTDQAQQLAGQAATDFQSLVMAEGQNRSEVAKIIAQGQAARDALLAAKGGPPINSQRAFSFRVIQDVGGQMRVEKIDDGGGVGGGGGGPPNFNLARPTSDVSEVIKQRCLSCHGSGKVSAGLDFTKPITDAQQRRCLDLITEENPQKRMPKNAPKLTVDEMSAFFRAMGGAQSK